MKSVLFLVRTAPYGSAAIPEGVRACMGFATMPLDLSFLLTDDATWALAPNQRPESIGAPSVLGLIEGLLDADVKVLADREALQARGLKIDDLPDGVSAVNPEELAGLVRSSHAILTY